MKGFRKRPEQEASTAAFRISNPDISDLIDSQAGQIASLQAQIYAGIANTSSNSNAVANLGLVMANDPPQIGESSPSRISSTS